MAKKKQIKKKQNYFIIKLAPNVSAWCDPSNNIYLSRGRKDSKRLPDNCDMKMINKGVKAGLVLVKLCEEEIVEYVEVKEPVKKEVKEPVVEEKVEEQQVEEKREINNAALSRIRAKRNKDEAKVEINVIEDNNDKEE